MIKRHQITDMWILGVSKSSIEFESKALSVNGGKLNQELIFHLYIILFLLSKNNLLKINLLKNEQVF